MNHFYPYYTTYHQQLINQQPTMVDLNKEARINLAMQAIQSHDKLSCRKAAQMYGVSFSTLTRRMAGKPTHSDHQIKNRRLTPMEEDTIVQYVLDLDSRGYPPTLSAVADMADHILVARGERHVGKHWVQRFVKRRTEFKVRRTCIYDFQRALCEDPELISKWFKLYKSVRDKYGIVDADIWNFDETGFMMGIIHAHMVVTRAERRGRAKKIQPGDREWATAIIAISATGEVIPPYVLVKGVIVYGGWFSTTRWPNGWQIKPTENGWTDNETGLDWIKHFNKHTIERTKGQHRLLVLDGHESHNSVAFQEYCHEHRIIALSLPPHSSHLTQPADVGLFDALKKAYGIQIDEFIKSNITHIDKSDFLTAFSPAFKTAITAKNAKAGFEGTGLVPFNPQEVISKLDIRLRTPLPTPGSSPPWSSHTPQNPKEALAQRDLIKDQVARHQSSSPTPLFQSIAALAKATEAMANKVVLLHADNKRLRIANRDLSKRRKAPRIELKRREACTSEEATQILARKDLVAQIKSNGRSGEENPEGDSPTQRHCSICQEPGHNKRTCPNRLIDPALVTST